MNSGIRVLSHDLIERLEISDRVVETVIAREESETAYRGDAPASHMRGRTVILVDDGIATGATMWAAAAAVRQQQPKRLVIAVPVAPPSTGTELATQADDVVCVAQPEPFYAIGEFYRDFPQVSDEEVRELLQRAARRCAARGASSVA